MSVDFEAIIGDESTFPDALELTIGDKKVPLGSIRDLSKKKQARVTEELSRLEAERTGLSAKQREVMELSTKAAAIYDDLQKKLAAANTVTHTDGLDPNALYDSDPWYAPIRTRNAKIEEGQKALQTTLGQLTQAVTGAVSAFIEDRWEREFEGVEDRVKKSKAIKDWDFNKLKTYATENKIHDKRGLPSIRAAVDRLTEQEREQEKAEEAYARGLREGELKARMGVQPRPASAAAAMGGGKGPETLDEALNPEAIAQDPELAEMLANLGVAASAMTTN